MQGGTSVKSQRDLLGTEARMKEETAAASSSMEARKEEEGSMGRRKIKPPLRLIEASITLMGKRFFEKTFGGDQMCV